MPVAYTGLDKAQLRAEMDAALAHVESICASLQASPLVSDELSLELHGASASVRGIM